jgi:hypothetical protein
MSATPTCGFVYVATGSAYLAEARHSASTLRALHPEASICLITDHPPESPGPFSAIRTPTGPVEHKPIDKLLAFEAPYERIVFLDTDTHVLGDLSPVLEVLDRFDFALVPDVNRGWNYDLPGLPRTFAEFNTGLVAFRKTDSTAAFFRDWRTNFERFRSELARQGQPPAADQPTFRYTLYHSALRVAPLPNEFHFLCDYPNATMWDVRLLHGRSDYGRVSRQLNSVRGLRTFQPELGAFPAYAGRQQLLRSLFRILLRGLVLCLRGSRSVVSKHPWKWWLPRAGANARKP